MKTRRLFFALWPSASTRQSIVDTASPYIFDLKGRATQPANLHITLHFVGQVNDAVKDRMHKAARGVSGRLFVLDLNSYGHFSKAKIFWMGMQEIPSELVYLHNKLGDALTECGYCCEQRPYRPHITLMRKCAGTDLKYSNFSIPWTVNEFVMVESVQDGASVNYRVIEHYPLF